MISPSRLIVDAPFSTPRNTSHAPLSVVIRSSAVTGTPQFLAKAMADWAGAPCASKALASGGPRFSTLRSGWLPASFSTHTASRRGVAKLWKRPWAMPAASRPLTIFSVSAADRVARERGGSSSVPSSNNKSRALNLSDSLNRVLEQRKPKRFPAAQIRLGDGARQSADAQDEALPLGHRNRMPGVEQIKGMRCLRHLLIG